MLKHIPTVAGVLLGLTFIAAALMMLLQLVEAPPPEQGSAAEHFIVATGPTGYLTFVKVCELIGGVLVAVPMTRRLGLVVLTPIVVNIVAFHLFIMDGEGMVNPLFIAAVALTVYLLLVERKTILGLVGRRTVKVQTA